MQSISTSPSLGEIKNKSSKTRQDRKSLRGSTWGRYVAMIGVAAFGLVGAACSGDAAQDSGDVPKTSGQDGASGSGRTSGTRDPLWPVGSADGGAARPDDLVDSSADAAQARGDSAILDSGQGDRAIRDGGSTGQGAADGNSGQGAADGNAGGNRNGLPDGALVVYWGQNGFGGANPGDPSKWEKPLAEVCSQNPHYDAIVMGFVISFISTQNADKLPALNFANHCETPYDTRNPMLLRCPEIEEGIKTCHKLNKKVFLSLGGASGAYGFRDDAEGEAFAKTTWELFLGGKSKVRPFGDAILDGVDLDIEGGSTTGYTAYVKKLRQLTKNDASRRYFIAGAPQCPMPDAYLGPGAGKPLGDYASGFDYLFVQFYNNYCAYSAGGTGFKDAFQAWTGLGQNGGPKIFVGLPSAPAAAPAGGYVQRGDLQGLVKLAKGNPAFGGIMLWDVSFDQNSVQAGQTYGGYVSKLLR